MFPPRNLPPDETLEFRVGAPVLPLLAAGGVAWLAWSLDAFPSLGIPADRLWAARVLVGAFACLLLAAGSCRHRIAFDLASRTVTRRSWVFFAVPVSRVARNFAAIRVIDLRAARTAADNRSVDGWDWYWWGWWAFVFSAFRGAAIDAEPIELRLVFVDRTEWLLARGRGRDRVVAFAERVKAMTGARIG